VLYRSRSCKKTDRTTWQAKISMFVDDSLPR
jgi:hypothetical protein